MKDCDRTDTGVYCFLNIQNGKRYTGSGASSGGVKARYDAHVKALKIG